MARRRTARSFSRDQERRIVGAAGGEFGIRGFIDATDLKTGQQLWRTYTIPGEGEPGNETWKDGKDHWVHGGGSIWETATYDPETDTYFSVPGDPRSSHTPDTMHDIKRV